MNYKYHLSLVQMTLQSKIKHLCKENYFGLGKYKTKPQNTTSHPLGWNYQKNIVGCPGCGEIQTLVHCY